MAGIGLIAGLLGSVVSAVGTIASGSAQAEAGKFAAKQYQMKADSERAAATREAADKHREGQVVESRLQANAAASGFGAGALDPTVADLASDIAGRSNYNQRLAIYSGEERARGNEAEAAAAKYNGQAAQTGSFFSAAGTLVGGLSSFAGKYGGSGYGYGQDPLQQRSIYNYSYG